MYDMVRCDDEFEEVDEYTEFKDFSLPETPKPIDITKELEMLRKAREGE